jgi:HK97 family phage portal protein
VGLLDFLKHPGGGKTRGWDALPTTTTDLAPLGQQKAVTVNGAEYVPPLFHGPGATEAYEAFVDGYAGRGDGNSAVFACLMALSMAYFEPPVRVYRTDPRGNRRPVNSGAPLDLQDLLDHPNPYMSPAELWFWAAYSQNIDGNAYLEKVRAVGGNVVQLVPRSPHQIKPITEKGSGNLIDWYKFTYAPGKWEPIAVEDMVHLKLGFDDRDHRIGLAPIKRLLRHVCADDEASRFATTLLQNFGLPGLVVQTPDKSLSEEQAEKIKAKVSGAFGNDNRGNVGVLSNGATMSQFGFSPEQLNLKALHQIPETRIAAVMRVPPAVVGLSVGLEQTSNFASFEQIREQFVEQTLAPLWRLRDDKLNAQLLPEFSSIPSVSIATDLSVVRALQEDENKLHQRASDALESGGISLNEYRQMIGQDPLPSEIGDCHLISGRFVPRAEIGMMPEAPVLPAAGPPDGSRPRPLRAVGE